MDLRQVEEDGIMFDGHGRMKFHPDFHFSHGESFTDCELEYLCKYYEVDHARTLSFAMGKTEGTLRSKVDYLKKNGLYDYYKNLNKHWIGVSDVVSCFKTGNWSPSETFYMVNHVPVVGLKETARRLNRNEVEVKAKYEREQQKNRHQAG
ncbi:MAG: hypothetical protein ACQET8_17220 [Bacillota bacterium]